MVAAGRAGRGLLLLEPGPEPRRPANATAAGNGTAAAAAPAPGQPGPAHAGGVVDVGGPLETRAGARVGLETVVIIGVLAAISLAAGFYLALAATTRKAKRLVSFKPRALSPAASRREPPPPPDVAVSSGPQTKPRTTPSASAAEPQGGALSPIPYALVQALGGGTSAEGPQSPFAGSLLERWAPGDYARSPAAAALASPRPPDPGSGDPGAAGAAPSTAQLLQAFTEERLVGTAGGGARQVSFRRA